MSSGSSLAGMFRSVPIRDHRTYLSEWQPMQYCAKLRAPRWSEAVSATLVPAFHASQSVGSAEEASAFEPCPFSAAASSAAQALPPSSSNARAHEPSTRMSLPVRPISMSMIDHSLRHRLHGVPAGIERHQDPEQEVQPGENAADEDVQPFRRPHPHESQSHERDDEDGQGGF